jgi:hypothetical protein
MAKKNFERTGTDALLKQRRFMHVLIGVFIGVALIWVVLLVLDFIEDQDIELLNLSGLMAPLAMVWIPVSNLKKINRELQSRGKR